MLAIAMGVVTSPNIGAASLRGVQDTGSQSNLLHVRYDLGGKVIEYLRDVSRLRMTKTQVAITGRCDSACTLLLSLPPELVCISGNATFGFHKAYGGSAEMNDWATDLMWKSYPVWVQDWIASNGGMQKGITRMSFNRAATHMRECNQNVRGNQIETRKSFRQRRP